MKTGNNMTEATDIAAYFDADHATIYDRRIRQRCPSYEALHTMLVSWLKGLPESAHILSVGAGTGAEILTLGRRFPNWRFVAADISADMLGVCRERMERNGLADRVEFHLGAPHTLPVGETFDAATSVLVSHFILERTERQAYYQAIAERLRPGGVFILADLFGDSGAAEFPLLLDAWFASFAEQAVSADDHAKDLAHVMRDIAFLPETELLSMLETVGFEKPTRFYQTWLFGGWVMTRRQ
jgi:tRNA (cmo5U34)-methyltransferase